MMQKYNGKQNSTVVLIKSSATEASQISESEVRQMVRHAVKLTGGLTDIIKDGQSVVLKPNLVTPRVTPGTYHTMKMLITNPYKDKKHGKRSPRMDVERRTAQFERRIVSRQSPDQTVYPGKKAQQVQHRRKATKGPVRSVQDIVRFDQSGLLPDVGRVEPRKELHRRTQHAQKRNDRV